MPRKYLDHSSLQHTRQLHRFVSFHSFQNMEKNNEGCFSGFFFCYFLDKQSIKTKMLISTEKRQQKGYEWINEREREG